MVDRYRLVWTEIAARDYESISMYIAARDGIFRAKRVLKKFEQRIASLVTHPKRCRLVPELREQAVSVYREQMMKPYRIMFRVTGKEVVVLAVLDGRRDVAELLIERALGR